MSDDRLIAALRDLGTTAWFPEAPDVSHSATTAPSRRPHLGRTVAVAVLVVAILAILISPVREAVADWLGIGAVRIVEVDDTPTAGDEIVAGLGDEVDPERWGLFGDLWPEPLGTPDRLFVRDLDQGVRAIAAVWLPRDGLPEVGDSGVGALLTRFEGTLQRAVVEKSVGEDATVTMVEVGGAVGYWIEGDPHIFAYLDRNGETIEESIRLAGNTLLWEADGISFRFESGLDRAAALAAVSSLED